MTKAVWFDPDLKLFLTRVRRQSLLDACRFRWTERFWAGLSDPPPFLKAGEWIAQQRLDRRDGQDCREDF